MKKFISLFLVFSILTLSGNLYPKERRGAELIIQRTDGTQVRGELIAVKENSLLLMERESGADESVDVSDINKITIVEKSKFLSWAGLGFLIGAGIGAALGAAQAGNREVTSGEGATQGAVFLGVPCALIGGIAGTFTGIDKKIKFAGKSDSEIQEILENLRKKARIKNVQ